MLVAVRHNNKHIYCCMSQYSSKWYVMTDVTQLLKLRNIKHMDPPRTNKRLNVRKQQIYYNGTLRRMRVFTVA